MSDTSEFAVQITHKASFDRGFTLGVIYGFEAGAIFVCAMIWLAPYVVVWLK